MLIDCCIRVTSAGASAFFLPSSSPRPLPAHVIDSKRCLREYGFAYAPGFGQRFAQQFIQLMGEDIAKRKKQTIAGGVQQFAMPRTGSSPWPTKLRQLWHALVVKLAEHTGVEPDQLQLLVSKKPAAAAAAASAAVTAAAAAAAAAAAPTHTNDAEPQLHVQDEKLLVASRQKGEQAPHFDRDDTANKLKQVYTIILYLTDGVDSTAFPQFPLDEFALPEFDDKQEVQNAAAMRATVERGCLKKKRYDRWPVRIGDMALFTQATMVRQQCVAIAVWTHLSPPLRWQHVLTTDMLVLLQHFGTKNNVLHERMALFSVLTPFEEKRQDDYQVSRRSAICRHTVLHAIACFICRSLALCVLSCVLPCLDLPVSYTLLQDTAGVSLCSLAHTTLSALCVCSDLCAVVPLAPFFQLDVHRPRIR